MKYIKNVFLILMILLSASVFTSCEKQEEIIVFDNEYPLALSPSVKWAVVKEPYAAYKSNFGWDAKVIGHCRRGEILQIQGQCFDEEGKKWCYFDDGWLPESCLNIYSNRLKAQRVAKILEQENEK